MNKTHGGGEGGGASSARARDGGRPSAPSPGRGTLPAREPGCQDARLRPPRSAPSRFLFLAAPEGGKLRNAAAGSGDGGRCLV